MAYQRKTEDEWVIQGYYGQQYGWEDVSVEESYKEGKAQLKTYRENEPGTPHRMRKRRVKIEQTQVN